jgi:hypothetical protein
VAKIPISNMGTVVTPNGYRPEGHDKVRSEYISEKCKSNLLLLLNISKKKAPGHHAVANEKSKTV